MALHCITGSVAFDGREASIAMSMVSKLVKQRLDDNDAAEDAFCEVYVSHSSLTVGLAFSPK